MCWYTKEAEVGYSGSDEDRVFIPLAVSFGKNHDAAYSQDLRRVCKRGF